MKNNIRCLHSEKIEINSSSANKRELLFNTHSKIRIFLHDLWEKFVKSLLADPNDLQVWQKVDRYGNTYWNAYHPATGKSFSSGSEADVSMWIEQLYKS
ncbi:hypothetical protein [Dendronalium phyllosphericum]|uniref:hypothetical protein n=1 Tax=Dendronalium phyllosphericum TaxID=2840445 RepID=UPI001CED4897|nr:hypothetical protein [Dendronalium phyllosphericum]